MSKSQVSLTAIKRLDIKTDVVMVAAVVDPVAAAAFSSSTINCLETVCYLKTHSRNN